MASPTALLDCTCTTGRLCHPCFRDSYAETHNLTRVSA